MLTWKPVAIFISEELNELITKNSLSGLDTKEIDLALPEYGAL
jgi:hypothetical protein